MPHASKIAGLASHPRQRSFPRLVFSAENARKSQMAVDGQAFVDAIFRRKNCNKASLREP